MYQTKQKKTLVLFHSSVHNTYIRLENQNLARFAVLSIKNAHRAKKKRFVFRFDYTNMKNEKRVVFRLRFLTLKRMLRSPPH